MSTAEAIYRSGRPADALALLDSASSDDPMGSRRAGEAYLLLRGACLARLKRIEEATLEFERLLARYPENYEALTWMAVLKKDGRGVREAVGYAHRAIALRPEDAVGYGALGTCLLLLREPIPAVAAFRRATELAPEVAEHRHNLALALLMDHQHGEAIPHLRAAIALAPHSPSSYLTLAGAYSTFGMVGDAMAVLEDALSVMPDCAALHSAAAANLAMIRNEAAAEGHHRRAVALSSGARRDYGLWLLNQGRFPEAEIEFTSLIKDGTDPAFGYYGLSQASHGADLSAPMRELLDSGSLRPGSQMFLRYALGRAEERAHRYEAAMSHFDAANELAFAYHHAGHPIDPESFASEHAQVHRLSARLKPGSSVEAPIFIIGMIRSGTTLLDQIVSNHPDVASAGELRFWIEETLRIANRADALSDGELDQLANRYLRYVRLILGSDRRFTDKMPLNFAYVGVIAACLPQARFLHIRRHPVDTALSIYSTYFAKGALFAYRKENIVAYYRAYLQAMEHWRDALPAGRMLEIDYEALVSSPESVIPDVIDFCGLPWDDACLHPEQNDAAINTPSRWQARQPVYTTSAGKWRNYEPWLGEFRSLR